MFISKSLIQVLIECLEFVLIHEFDASKIKTEINSLG